MTDNRFYEADIQELILNKKRIFGDIGESAIVFEKAVMRGNTICDCLIFTEKRGVIGIEIKTERDSTKRLNKQLKDYEKVCDFAYVLCHDTHVPKVEQILNRYNHRHVGILAYTEFMGEAMLGIYKEATPSPSKSAYHMLDILWKEEILKMLGTFRHYGIRVETATGTKFMHTANRSGGVSGLYTKSATGRTMRKPDLIRNLINRVGGAEEATRVFCDVFIHNRQHPEKAIKLRHFKQQPIRSDNNE